MSAMTCPDATRLLSLDFDGELGSETAFALARHLDTCPSCASRFAAERALEQRLRSAVVPDAPLDAQLWQHIEASLRTRSAFGREWHSRRAFLALAIAAAVVVAWTLPWRSADTSLLHALVVMHEKVLGGTELPQAEFEDAESAHQFFGERLPFPVPVGAGVDVRGGRVCSVRGQKLALLFARDAGQAVSMFTVPDGLVATFPEDVRTLAEADVVTHRHGDIVLVARREADRLVAAAGQLPADHLQRLLARKH